uniref:Uncharacterized protein n=2 Tax=Oryza sativa subsp. japonica TaxID=39947 RepID=Q8S616_ORYSJ|nr:hypothetical protein [Oryza sativa Japonica Group]AAP52716.1 hypothetical protein LOC_Os10g13710 [Oryza sativa Japonica Group]
MDFRKKIIVQEVLEIIDFQVMNTGDLMPRESICGDGPGVGLGLRRRPWWSEIMWKLRLELMHVVGEDFIWHTMEVLCEYGMRS